MKTIRTRPTRAGISRTRACRVCGQRIYSLEQLVRVPIGAEPMVATSHDRDAYVSKA